MSKGHLRKDVAQKLGISASTIQLYTDNEVIEPEIVSPPRGEGKGIARRYSDFNIVEILIVKEFTKRGVKLRVLKKIMQIVRKEFKFKNELDPKSGILERDKVYMIIWDHTDEKKVKVQCSTLTDLSSGVFGGYKALSKKSRDKITWEATHITIDMTGKMSAIILNVSELWASL